jgi:hypothetical protein
MLFSIALARRMQKCVLALWICAVLVTFVLENVS